MKTKSTLLLRMLYMVSVSMIAVGTLVTSASAEDSIEIIEHIVHVQNATVSNREYVFPLAQDTVAEESYDSYRETEESYTSYTEERLANSVNAILMYIEGSPGAMVMVGSALIGLILLAVAFGKHKRKYYIASLACLLVAVLSFILRSMVGTFYNDQNLQAIKEIGRFFVG